MITPSLLTYLGKYVVRSGNDMSLSADLRQLPVVLKGAGGVAFSLASTVVSATNWEPAAKALAIVLGLLISAATLVNIAYGIIIRHKKLRLLDEGKDVSDE